MSEILEEFSHINNKIDKLSGFKKFIQLEISENSLRKIPLIERLYKEVIEPAAKETDYSVSVDVSNFAIDSGKVPFDGEENSFMRKYAKPYVEDYANKPLKFVLENSGDSAKVMFVELSHNRLGVSLENGTATHYVSPDKSMVQIIKGYQTIKK